MVFLHVFSFGRAADSLLTHLNFRRSVRFNEVGQSDREHN